MKNHLRSTLLALSTASLLVSISCNKDDGFVNSDPVINDQSFSVAENSATGSQVGAVEAFDANQGQELTYIIISGNINEAFLFANDGVLIVNNAEELDYEVNDRFTLVVNVLDGFGGSDEATITINVEDLVEAKDLEVGVIAFYPFNGNADDQSGNGLNGTVVGASLTSDRNGNLNSAYEFDGINDYIDLREREEFDLARYQHYAISVWIKPANITTGVILSKYISAGDNRMWWMNLNEGSILYTVPEDGLSGLENYDRLSSEADLNVWRHVVLNFDGANYTLYIDAEVRSTVVKSKNMLLESPTAKTLIGGIHFSSSLFDLLYEGVIDDVRFHSRSLSEPEIEYLFTN